MDKSIVSPFLTHGVHTGRWCYAQASFHINALYKFHFYHTMHFSAKRGLAIACHLSVCDVGGL